MLSKLQSILSDEELIAMEENERRKVEVQINRLRNIQVFLNTAIIGGFQLVDLIITLLKACYKLKCSH